MIGNFDRSDTSLRNVSLAGSNFAHEPTSVVHRAVEASLDFNGLMNPATLGISIISIDLDQGVLSFSR